MLIIAEIGLNHNGNMDIAKCLIEEAKKCGADVAKFQIFDPREYFSPEFEWFDSCMKAMFDYDQVKQLKEYCDRIGIEYMASVFNLEGVQWCEKLNMKRYKIASRVITKTEIIEAVCHTGKDIIVSLGMWDGKEFPEIETKGHVDYLYCVSNYPTMPEDIHFEKIDFNKYSGFSDHTIGIDAATIAMARGGRIIEKHFTLSKKMFGPDHSGSMEPAELKELVNIARRFERFLK